MEISSSSLSSSSSSLSPGVVILMPKLPSFTLTPSSSSTVISPFSKPTLTLPSSSSTSISPLRFTTTLSPTFIRKDLSPAASAPSVFSDCSLALSSTDAAPTISSPRSNASMVIPNISDMAMRLSVSGYASPLSHFDTACLETSSFSANSSCESPALLLNSYRLFGRLFLFILLLLSLTLL